MISPGDDDLLLRGEEFLGKNNTVLPGARWLLFFPLFPHTLHDRGMMSKEVEKRGRRNSWKRTLSFGESPKRREIEQHRFFSHGTR